MAYQIKRRQRVQETLELCNAAGEVELSIDVDITVDEMGGRIANAQNVLAMAQELIAKEPESEKAQEAFGSAVIAMFAVIFGKDNAHKLLTYYEARYTEMLLDVLPFINEVVMPKVREACEARKKQLLDAANIMRRR